MTDAQLREMLANLMRINETHDDAAMALVQMIKASAHPASQDDALVVALCRYVIDRMVPLVGTVG